MGVATTLEDYLQGLQVSYDIIEHTHTDSSLRTAEAAHISGDCLAKSVLLGDEHSYLLAVVPATYRLEVGRLNEITARSLEIINEDEIEATFSDCEKGAIPAVGEAYGIDTLVDTDLVNQSEIYFESGDHEHLIHMNGEDFRKLMANTKHLHIGHHL